MNDVDVCNIAQRLLGAEPLGSITPPSSVNEKRYASVYATYRDGELRKRRWNFSRRHYSLTPSGTPIQTDTQLFYRFALPAEVLRPIRESGSRWSPNGQILLAEQTGPLSVWCITRVPAAEFDPLFSIMLAAKLAETLCEAITQSNEKKAVAKDQYEMARREAGAANAFEIGPELIASDDSAFSWIAARNA